MIAACIKWVDRRPQVDPLDGVVTVDPRRGTMSDADAAALEWALRCGDAWDEPVLALTAGPDGAASVLRDALACGAARAVQIDLSPTSASRVVAAAIAGVLREHRVATVWCGDHSIDRGSGSVPAYLAAEMGTAQALGLIDVEVRERADLVVLRRLDGGRRERLRVRGGVLSVEGASAPLRRAALAAALAAGTGTIEVHRGPPAEDGTPALLRPFRPRARALAAPHGASALDRIVELLDVGASSSHGEVVVLDPAAAADRLLAALAAWGYEPAPTEP
jgi:electron transfer flavoprotein beta subunit